MKQRKQRMSVILALAMICSLLVGGFPTGIREVKADDTVNMYRLYNPNTGEHFYTGNTNEEKQLSTNGWQYEGVGWVAPISTSVPIYRLYNPYNGDHHYTKDSNEKSMLVGAGWKDEGIGWYSADDSAIPMYRLYNPNNKKAGSHHYTTSAGEKSSLISSGWKDEGIGWYAVSEGSPAPVVKPAPPAITTYGNVSGNITYFYNNYRGNVADTNARVIFINKDGRAKDMPTLSDKVYWMMPDKINQYNDYGVFMTQVDGSGRYSINIPTAEYMVVIISNRATSESAFRNKGEYEYNLASAVNPYINPTNAQYLGQEVLYWKYTTTSVTVMQNLPATVSHDFGMSYN